jgi:hypothetical protein
VQTLARRTALAAPLGLIVALGLVVALALAACGTTARRTASSCQACAAEFAQIRVNAFATVAKLTYAEEVYGAPNGSAYHVISHVRGLLDGLATGDYAEARYAMHHQPIRHAVAVRVTLDGRTLIHVGLRFVVGGRVHALHNQAGQYLGQIEVSIQDVIGFIKLIHRLTGCEVVVQGSTGQAMSSLAAAVGVPLPAKGPVDVAGRVFTVASFTERGFAGEPLNVWILDPA